MIEKQNLHGRNELALGLEQALAVAFCEEQPFQTALPVDEIPSHALVFNLGTEDPNVDLTITRKVSIDGDMTSEECTRDTMFCSVCFAELCNAHFSCMHCCGPEQKDLVSFHCCAECLHKVSSASAQTDTRQQHVVYGNPAQTTQSRDTEPGCSGFRNQAPLGRPVRRRAVCVWQECLL